MTDKTLMPCPFCGNKPAVGQNKKYNPEGHTVWCPCGTHGPVVTGREPAIIAWNSRQQSSPASDAKPPTKDFRETVTDRMMTDREFCKAWQDEFTAIVAENEYLRSQFCASDATGIKLGAKDYDKVEKRLAEPAQIKPRLAALMASDAPMPEIEAVLDEVEKALSRRPRKHLFENREKAKAILTRLVEAATAKARNEALEEAALCAEWAHMVPPDGGSASAEEQAVATEAASRIRALKSAPTTQQGA